MKIPMQPILLVEADDGNRKLDSWYFTQAGYVIVAAASDAESIALARTGQFKLYLLGEGFEDTTNLNICQQIRTFDSDTPVLFCSAWVRPADHDRGINAGAQAYLTKPCDLDELVQTVEQLIAKAAAGVIRKRASRRRTIEIAMPRPDASRLKRISPSV